MIENISIPVYGSRISTIPDSFNEETEALIDINELYKIINTSIHSIKFVKSEEFNEMTCKIEYDDANKIIYIKSNKDIIVPNTTDLSYLFRLNYSLTDISGLSNWDVSNVINMELMFFGCVHLSNISPLSGWNVKSLVNAESMFGWTNIEDASLLSTWFNKIEYSCINVTGMLYNTEIKNINFIKDWDLPHMNISRIFGACTKLTDISIIKEKDLSKAYAVDLVFDESFSINTPDDIVPINCPEKGSFYGYKALTKNNKGNKKSNYILKLEIPEDALRTSSIGKKCRCSKAKVIRIYKVDIIESNDPITLKFVSVDICNDETLELRSDHDMNFIYKLGKEIIPNGFSKYRWTECSKGIHFFMDVKDLLEYFDMSEIAEKVKNEISKIDFKEVAHDRHNYGR